MKTDSYIPVLKWNKKFVEISNDNSQFYITIPISLYETDGYSENKKKILTGINALHELELNVRDLENRARTVITKRIGEEISVQQKALSNIYKSLINRIITENCTFHLKGACVSYSTVKKNELMMVVSFPIYYYNKQIYTFITDYINSLPKFLSPII